MLVRLVMRAQRDLAPPKVYGATGPGTTFST